MADNAVKHRLGNDVTVVRQDCWQAMIEGILENSPIFLDFIAKENPNTGENAGVESAWVTKFN